MGVYIAPNDTTTLERVVEAIRRKPRGAELLVAGEFNVDIATPEGDRRAEDMATELATAGLEDMARHFLPQEKRWCRDRRTWGMLRKGQEVWFRTDYTLGMDSYLFRNVTVWDPRHNLDHYMVLGCLPSAPLSETKQYLGGRKRWPVRSPVKPSRTDELFAALRRAVPRPKPREARRNAWISAETWKLIDERVSARRDPRYGTLYRWQMGKAVQ